MTKVKVLKTDNNPQASQIQTVINDFCETVHNQGGTVVDIKFTCEAPCFNVDSCLMVMIIYTTT